MLYQFMLEMHNHLRWAALGSMLYAAGRGWAGLLGDQCWGKAEETALNIASISAGTQFAGGLMLYMHPQSVVAEEGEQRALIIPPTEEGRFFSQTHAAAMLGAVSLAHLAHFGAYSAESTQDKYRWAAFGYSAALIVMLAAVPWWRPLMRLPGQTERNPERTLLSL